MILLSDDEKKLRLNGVKGSNGNGDGIKVNRDGGSNRNGNGRPRLTRKWIELLIDPDPGNVLALISGFSIVFELNIAFYEEKRQVRIALCFKPSRKVREMNIFVVSITSLFYFIFFWNPLFVSINGYENPTACYIGDVAINCGYYGNSTAVDGRPLFGDTGTRSVISVLQPMGKSTSSTVDRRWLYLDPIPYMTARISASEFYYTFQVNPGPKFIRLHFYPSFYRGFESSQDFFTVKAGSFTLLSNFSASLAADALDVNTALEMVLRLNIGGSSISPGEDFGMFRRWGEDANYFLESELELVSHLVHQIKYTGMSTSWKRGDKMHNFTWKIPVDVGFGYLERLHFCDFDLETRGCGQREFKVVINNQVAEDNADVQMEWWRWKDKESGKSDLLVPLRSSDELVIRLLNGLEMFKLSNPDNNLASPNPFKQVSISRSLKIQNLLLSFGKTNAIAIGIMVLLISLNLTTYHEEKDPWHILSATQNFSDAFLIGKGGFGNVYKGFLPQSSEIVAIKRLKSNSKQGAHEFWTEIETLSKIRHNHLVSLDGTPLTWEQRLKICIGAARGLDYLHTGIEFGVIHCDVKDSNILLDENLVAKISDFGLSKLGKISESQVSISTKVKGTFDVYAFGVVMLVVLCGRPTIDKRIPWDPQSLLSLFQECMTKGDIDDIIDPSLQGKFSSESLKEFVKCVENCVQPQPKKRPTMSQLVTSLESEEACISGHPCNGAIVQQIVINEFCVSPTNPIGAPLEEGIASRVIQGPELQTRREDSQSSRKRVWLANFSDHHLIGHGRFGSVYKVEKVSEGTLPSGQDIALRRLSVPAWQGTEEFITKVQLLSKLEHRNIVRLLGFCCEGEGSMLIHEFVPNKSLEGFLFDPKKQPMLDWSRRQKIIEGIARGLLYLHDESEVRIIHRDLKVSNVLLDANMNPKIADSGLARIWQVYLNGYTSPEYFSHCQYSVKSDVYSFGILVLEIICGKKKLINHSDGTTESLIRYAWREQMDGTPLAMLDPAVGDPDSYDGNEVIRYIQVALLCVQDDAENRPTMASVPHMLLNSSVTLPAPQQPARVFHE
ncbi:hypothetical protein M9H77_34512 [Catharanthus roseus]|uniref:Uncharacterized protein n=1 Tax=Catharanthus roseus TaxID=4058 RepID=A0ACB9ZNI9_CATRO|nr:hypothetical protein M9H77_34512 [Catharanthus roseus]